MDTLLATASFKFCPTPLIPYSILYSRFDFDRSILYVIYIIYALSVRYLDQIERNKKRRPGKKKRREEEQ